MSDWYIISSLLSIAVWPMGYNTRHSCFVKYPAVIDLCVFEHCLKSTLPTASLWYLLLILMKRQRTSHVWFLVFHPQITNAAINQCLRTMSWCFHHKEKPNLCRQLCGVFILWCTVLISGYTNGTDTSMTRLGNTVRYLNKQIRKDINTLSKPHL